MYKFSRNRYVAGNICFILFLVFLFSLTFSVNPGTAMAALPVEGHDEAIQQPTGSIEVKLAPTTDAQFADALTQLQNAIAGVTNNIVSKIVYSKVYHEVYTAVYNNVYSNVYAVIYSFTAYLVYAPATSYDLATPNLTITFQGFRDDGSWGNITPEVKVPIPKTAPSGGGGGAPAPAPSATPTDYGQVKVDTSTGTVTVTVEAGKMESLLNQAAPTVTLPVTVPAGTEVKQVEVPIPAQILTQAAAKGKAIELALPNLQVVLPAGVVPAEQLASGNVTFKAEVLAGDAAKPYTSNLSSGMTAAGNVVDLNLSTASGSVSFAKPVTVALSYQTTGDPNLLGIYRYNEATKQWDYVGGRVNTATKQVEVRLGHFSKYAVMAYQKVFADTNDHWAKNDISLMAARHIAAGKTDSLFAPDDSVTRAEFAALLIRALGIAEMQPATARFSDVLPGAWCYGAVAAASQAGLVSGYEDGTFRPDALISREEMAAMITRALAYAGKPVTVDNAAVLLARFADASSVSSWAQQAMAAAIQSGIVAGRTVATIEPQTNATRAEAIVMLKRLLVNTGAI